MHVVLAGGGSAGHVTPLLALADCLRRRDPGVGITAIGTAEGLESRLVPAQGYEFRVVPKVPLPRRPSAAALRAPGRLRAAVAVAAEVIREARADVVVGFGGYVSAPAYLAARRLRVPVVVHEANSRPGWANRLGARLTPYVVVAFRGTRLRRARVLGMPLRAAITTLDRTAARAGAARSFGLDPGGTTLLVTGGSLGAQRLNGSVRAAADDLRAAGVQVLHVTGEGKDVPPPDGPGPAYVVIPYAQRMELAFAAADLVLCRAGSNTVAEVTAVGLPAAYVPLPIGNGEQELNATPAVQAGAAVLVRDEACTPEWIRDVLVPLAGDRPRLSAMADAARNLAVLDGDERLADVVAEAAASRAVPSEGRP